MLGHILTFSFTDSVLAHHHHLRRTFVIVVQQVDFTHFGYDWDDIGWPSNDHCVLLESIELDLILILRLLVVVVAQVALWLWREASCGVKFAFAFCLVELAVTFLVRKLTPTSQI